MFSKAKRFNYPKPEPKEPPTCQRCTKNHSSFVNGSLHNIASDSVPSTSTTMSPISTPLSTPKHRSKLPKDLQQTLDRLAQMEERIINRCETMDSICRDFLNTPDQSQDEGFISLETCFQPVSEESATLAIEKPLIPEGFEDFVDICAEKVANLVLQKLEERENKKDTLWKSTKSVLQDLVRPKIVEGES